MNLVQLTSHAGAPIAGIFAVADHPHQFELRDASGKRIPFNTSVPADPVTVSHVAQHLERALADPTTTKPAWDGARHEIGRYLRGVPATSIGSCGDTHTVSIVSRAQQSLPYKIVAEPFTRSPTPAELERAVVENTAYRRVLYTPKAGAHQQVAMSVTYWVPPEVHDDVDQYFLVKRGYGISIVDGVESRLAPLSAFWVERGSRHEIRTTTAGQGPLKLFVAYTPKHHPAGRVDESNTDLFEFIEKSK